MEFRNQGEDLVYCKPGEATLEAIRDNIKLLETAVSLNVHLLYPMSGLDIEEPILQPGRIDVLMGQGQTAQSLRNLCLQVYQNNPEDWDVIADWVERLYSIELDIPSETARGSIDLFYRQQGVKEREKLDISLAGRGLLQTLLILAYLYSHRDSVLLIDEPDAHLELLRQNEVYASLRTIADKTESQVIIATHSEELLQEAANDNLTLLLGKKAHNLTSVEDTKKSEKIKNALKYGGAAHYIKALQRGYVLYVEGSTDIEILRQLSRKLEHKAAKLWDGRINAYHTQDIYPDRDGDLKKKFDEIEKGFGMNPKKHFGLLQGMIPDLRGLAILDSDNQNRKDFEDGNLRIIHWRRYEIENYIVSPETLRKYIIEKWYLVEGESPSLFDPQSLMMEPVDEILDEMTLEQVFHGNDHDFSTWKALESKEPNAARLVWGAQAAQIKMSEFAEDFFRRLKNRTGQRMLLGKGELYKLIPYIDADSIDPEVSKKLDMLADLFENAKPNE